MIRHHLFARATSGAALVLAAAFGAACTPSTTPAPVDESAGASFGPNDLSPGTHVTVNKNGQWLPGTIVQPLGADRFTVAYDGFGPQWNEAVGMDRIKAGAATAAVDYHPGDKVVVASQGHLMLGDVLQQVAAGTWRVHYDGYGPEAAENVASDRIHRPFLGVSAHPVGESVMVEANGQTLPAKVIAVTAQSRWLVRFDGYNPQYDQEVTLERIHAAPPVVVAPPPPVVAPPPPVVVAPPPAVEPPAKPEKDKGKKGKVKPEPVPVAAPVVAAPAVAAPPQIGDAVLVSQRGSWVTATITAAGANAGAWKVKYEGGNEDEVSSDRVQRLGALAKGARYNANQLVMVEWHGVFVPGKVLKEDGKGSYRIRFDGQGAESDEVVPVKRLHPR
jgi:hypothetical protein